MHIYLRRWYDWCRNLDAVEMQGWAIILLLRGHFEEAAFSGGPCIPMRVEASLGL